MKTILGFLFIWEKPSEMKLNLKRQVFLLENILKMISIHRFKYKKVEKSICQNIDSDRLSHIIKIRGDFYLFLCLRYIFSDFSVISTNYL